MESLGAENAVRVPDSLSLSTLFPPLNIAHESHDRQIRTRWIVNRRNAVASSSSPAGENTAVWDSSPSSLSRHVSSLPYKKGQTTHDPPHQSPRSSAAGFRSSNRSAHASPAPHGSLGGSAPVSTPVCRDYLKGKCRRGHRCKYHHPKEVTLPPKRRHHRQPH